MPTPFELLSDPASLIVFALYGALMLWEAIAPARDLPRIAGWKLRGLASFAFYFFLSSYLPLLWAQPLGRLQAFDLSAWPMWAAVTTGVLLYEAGVYAWHRAMHRYDILWRGFHQMHHSAERLDTYGAFWFSPLDMIGWTGLFSLCATLIGLPPEAATLVLLIATFLTVFQHSNIRTPRWLGYLVQRPESHSIHHRRGEHASNYSDLPLFDLLFGSFRNPRDFAPQAGFYDGASRRVADMLAGRDVSMPRS